MKIFLFLLLLINSQSRERFLNRLSITKEHFKGLSKKQFPIDWKDEHPKILERRFHNIPKTNLNIKDDSGDGNIWLNNEKSFPDISSALNDESCTIENCLIEIQNSFDISEPITINKPCIIQPRSSEPTTECVIDSTFEPSDALFIIDFSNTKSVKQSNSNYEVTINRISLGHKRCLKVVNAKVQVNNVIFRYDLGPCIKVEKNAGLSLSDCTIQDLNEPNSLEKAALSFESLYGQGINVAPSAKVELNKVDVTYLYLDADLDSDSVESTINNCEIGVIFLQVAYDPQKSSPAKSTSIAIDDKSESTSSITMVIAQPQEKSAQSFTPVLFPFRWKYNSLMLASQIELITFYSFFDCIEMISDLEYAYFENMQFQMLETYEGSKNDKKKIIMMNNAQDREGISVSIAYNNDNNAYEISGNVAETGNGESIGILIVKIPDDLPISDDYYSVSYKATVTNSEGNVLTENDQIVSHNYDIPLGVSPILKTMNVIPVLVDFRKLSETNTIKITVLSDDPEISKAIQQYTDIQNNAIEIKLMKKNLHIFDEGCIDSQCSQRLWCPENTVMRSKDNKGFICDDSCSESNGIPIVFLINSLDMAICFAKSTADDPCPSDTVPNNGKTKCYKCPGDCENCIFENNMSICRKCETSYLVAKDNECVENCPDYYTQNEATKTCDRYCPVGCKECLENRKCTSCESGYLLYPEKEPACQRATEHMKCDEGYSSVSGPNGRKCEKCQEHCIQCSTKMICTKCDDTYYVDANGECKKCGENCLVCISNNQCTRCDGEYSEKNGKCEKESSGDGGDPNDSSDGGDASDSSDGSDPNDSSDGGDPNGSSDGGDPNDSSDGGDASDSSDDGNGDDDNGKKNDNNKLSAGAIAGIVIACVVVVGAVVGVLVFFLVIKKKNAPSVNEEMDVDNL